MSVGFESEITKPFIEASQDLSEFFRGSVERLLHENLDYVVSDAWDGKSIEVLHIIDEFPIPGERLRYHYAYHAFDSTMPRATLGLVAAHPRILQRSLRANHEGFRPWAFRKNSRRHYFDTGQGLGIVACHYETRGVLATEPLEGRVEDPHQINDPLDNLQIRTLKVDVEALRRGTPVKPLSSLIQHFIKI